MCLTTRDNRSNLRYKAQLVQLLEELEQQGSWGKVMVQEIEKWERATSEEETVQGSSDYISGIVYVYRKSPGPGL